MAWADSSTARATRTLLSRLGNLLLKWLTAYAALAGFAQQKSEIQKENLCVSGWWLNGACNQANSLEHLIGVQPCSQTFNLWLANHSEPPVNVRYRYIYIYSIAMLGYDMTIRISPSTHHQRVTCIASLPSNYGFLLSSSSSSSSKQK